MSCPVERSWESSVVDQRSNAAVLDEGWHIVHQILLLELLVGQVSELGDAVCGAIVSGIEFFNVVEVFYG